MSFDYLTEIGCIILCSIMTISNSELISLILGIPFSKFHAPQAKFSNLLLLLIHPFLAFEYSWNTLCLFFLNLFKLRFYVVWRSFLNPESLANPIKFNLKNFSQNSFWFFEYYEELWHDIRFLQFELNLFFNLFLKKLWSIQV